MDDVIATNAYCQSLSYKKMSIDDAILVLRDARLRGFEFAVVRVSRKPYREWLRDQREGRDDD